MKTKIILGIFFLTILFTGCKNEKSVDNLELVKPEVVDTNFKVIVDVIVKKDDDFALYYTTDGSINFFSIPPVWQGVKGGEGVQQVTFIVPDEIIPTQVRVDFGMKQDQPDIVLKKMTLMYMGKTFILEGTKIFDYFQADVNQCAADSATGTITAKVKEGKRLTPSIYPNPELLGKEIELLTK